MSAEDLGVACMFSMQEQQVEIKAKDSYSSPCEKPSERSCLLLLWPRVLLAVFLVMNHGAAEQA